MIVSAYTSPSLLPLKINLWNITKFKAAARNINLAERSIPNKDFCFITPNIPHATKNAENVRYMYI